MFGEPEDEPDECNVTITWVVDERERCDHGCGQWKHAHHDDAVQCPRDADDHEISSCSLCHPGQEAKTCEVCGAKFYTSRHYSCPSEVAGGRRRLG